MSNTDPADETRHTVSRRTVLFGGAITGLGAIAAVGVESLVSERGAPPPPPKTRDDVPSTGQDVISFYGVHQAGVEVIPQAHQNLVALDLRPDTTEDDLRRLLQILSDDAARLTQGKNALADSEPELALVPAQLTVTFGFGRRLVELVSPEAVPHWLDDLPAFSKDKLEQRWSGGDLLLQIAADDQVTVAHAQRMLLKDARKFASLRWVQQGFRRARGSEKPGRTQRNLFGQLDGTVNATPSTPDFANIVWTGHTHNPAWLDGGTGFVIRRMSMHLETWDRLDRTGREQSIGRKMSTGAPLTGVRESDEPDLDAKTPIGFPVIAEFAHIRRARSDDSRQQIYRRAYNYDLEPDHEDDISNSGLIFTCFQHDVAAQFTPIQARLDELDLLNQWVSPIGSAVFAIPPGCSEGGFIGESLFAAGP